MISVRTGIRSEEVRFQGQHVLFIEGSDNSFDINMLNQLFDMEIKIEPLGASFSLTDVAKSLFKFHPTYYFLIDRDHHKQQYIDECWNNFPDPDKHNLLIWKRREIENYFLEPDYLFQSQYCQVSEETIEKKILECANNRLFLDVSNHVVTSIREELKQNWIQKFTNPNDFSSKDVALNKLLFTNEFIAHKDNVQQKVSQNEIKTRFHSVLSQMTDGADNLKFGQGHWLSMIQGKKVLSQVINSRCFQVKTSDGSNLNGREKLNEVIKDLLRKDAAIQPDDFIALKTLIDQRINGIN